ncbi:MAG: YheC/YheD family protein, partial [Gammaproteobacteria bacterium]
FVIELLPNFNFKMEYATHRILPMAQAAEELGVELFIYSFRYIDPNTLIVPGCTVGKNRLIAKVAQVPEVSGNWFIGPNNIDDKTALTKRDFYNLAQKHQLDLYSNNNFAMTLKDKLATYELLNKLLDKDTQPKTEIFTGEIAQIEKFLLDYPNIFLKPNKGNQGNYIFGIHKTTHDIVIKFYKDKKTHQISAKKIEDFLPYIANLINNTQYIIQEGIDTESYKDATFIIRIIFVDDGEQWHSVSKAVVSESDSDIANTTQGGYDEFTETLLKTCYGKENGEKILSNINNMTRDCIQKLEKYYPNSMMEIAFDLMIDKQQQIKIIEINTKPGMRRPGMPTSSSMFDLDKENPEYYQNVMLPYGKRLMHFLYSKLQERKSHG